MLEIYITFNIEFDVLIWDCQLAKIHELVDTNNWSDGFHIFREYHQSQSKLLAYLMILKHVTNKTIFINQ